MKKHDSLEVFLEEVFAEARYAVKGCRHEKLIYRALEHAIDSASSKSGFDYEPEYEEWAMVANLESGREL